MGGSTLVKTSLAEIGDDKAKSLQKLALIDERNAERLRILVTVGRGKRNRPNSKRYNPSRMAGATVEYSSLLTMKTRLSRLRSDFGPAYPEAIALEKQIEEMQTFLDNRAKSLLVSEQGIQITPDDVMNAYVNMLENDLRALEQQGQDVQSQMKQAEEQAKTLVSFILEDEQLLRKRTRLDDLYNSTIERLQALYAKGCGIHRSRTDRVAEGRRSGRAENFDGRSPRGYFHNPTGDLDDPACRIPRFSNSYLSRA
ncbi:MAG: hypothetical protein R3C56_02875 [Pirellulaceae bacterium]